MRYDSDFDIPIEHRLFGMMEVSLREHNICVSIEMHKDSKDFIVLQIQMYYVNEMPKKNIFSDFSTDFTELYYKANNFLLKELDIKYLGEKRDD